MIFRKRRQLIEFQDTKYCPRAVRDGVTDWLEFVLNLLRMYDPVRDKLEVLLAHSKERRFLDLCSGGSGPLLGLARRSGARVVLSDKFPNLPKFEYLKRKSGGVMDYITESTDARQVPTSVDLPRTLFSSFHHFSDTDARAILEDAYRQRRPIGIFEFTGREFWSILMTLPTPLMMALGTPLVMPFRWSRIILTYLMPLIPLVATGDVLVSVFRTRTPEELLELVRGFDESGYTWEAGTRRSAFWMQVVYLIGHPLQDRRSR